MNERNKVGIIGATSATARQLMKILWRHPRVDPVLFAAESAQGKRLGDIGVLPEGVFEPLVSTVVAPVFATETLERCRSLDLLFLCLAHGISMKFMAALAGHGGGIPPPRVIDLSGDFRLPDPQEYLQAYGEPHAAPDLLAGFVYGQPELFRAAIAAARCIANPGCYPTTVLLGLAPVAGEVTDIIVDAKSGYSGGGNKLIARFERPDGTVDTDCYAYQAGGVHRHIPEMCRHLARVAGKPVSLVFTPHVVPQYRGMLSSIYARFADSVDADRLRERYTAFYRDAPFVRVLPAGELPSTKAVCGTNRCDIGIVVQRLDPRMVTVFAAIDNLVKGAVGTAVQNMNIMFGMADDVGIVA
jgi:N-acetyl-gamma-glutamyl-phosphate reductase